MDKTFGFSNGVVGNKTILVGIMVFLLDNYMFITCVVALIKLFLLGE